MEPDSPANPPAVVEAPIPATPQSFAEFGVVAPIVEALALRDFHATFPIQALVLRDAIAGKDVLARSRTGSGKTLAFAIPIVQRLTHDRSSPSALILVPTRELTSQVAEEFRTIADVKQLRVATVYGGVGLKEQADRATKSDIVIATPGRLLDLFRRRLLSLNRVQIAVLDEADRMLDMGFLPDVSDILVAAPREAADDAVLGDARRRGRPPRGALHERADPPRDHRGPADDRGGAPSVHRGPARAEGRDAHARARRRPRTHADLLAHESRSRSAGADAEGAGVRRPSVARRHEPGGTRAGAGPVRRWEGRTSSWRPTSPLAGSTSSTSPTS